MVLCVLKICAGSGRNKISEDQVKSCWSSFTEEAVKLDIALSLPACHFCVILRILNMKTVRHEKLFEFCCDLTSGD